MTENEVMFREELKELGYETKAISHLEVIAKKRVNFENSNEVREELKRISLIYPDTENHGELMTIDTMCDLGFSDVVAMQMALSGFYRYMTPGLLKSTNEFWKKQGFTERFLVIYLGHYTKLCDAYVEEGVSTKRARHTDNQLNDFYRLLQGGYSDMTLAVEILFSECFWEESTEAEMLMAMLPDFGKSDFDVLRSYGLGEDSMAEFNEPIFKDHNNGISSEDILAKFRAGEYYTGTVKEITQSETHSYLCGEPDAPLPDISIKAKEILSELLQPKKVKETSSMSLF